MFQAFDINTYQIQTNKAYIFNSKQDGYIQLDLVYNLPFESCRFILKSGWNLIGSAYNINLSDAIGEPPPILNREVLFYKGSSVLSDTRLIPYQGYFAYSIYPKIVDFVIINNKLISSIGYENEDSTEYQTNDIVINCKAWEYTKDSFISSINIGNYTENETYTGGYTRNYLNERVFPSPFSSIMTFIENDEGDL